MKRIALNEKAEKGMAQLMVRALSEIGPRVMGQLTALETLGVVAMRMLVGSGAIQLEPLVSKGLDFLAQDEEVPPQALAVVKANLELAYDNEPELAVSGITFHGVQ